MSPNFVRAGESTRSSTIPKLAELPISLPAVETMSQDKRCLNSACALI
jgi:hypothetical protein